MPKGIQSFEKSNQAAKARRASQGDFIRADFFSLKDGEMARVRFLEQGDDITWAYCHRAPVSGSKWPQELICLDQEDEGAPCPICSSEDQEVRKRSKKGYLNVIWRGNEELAAENEKIDAENVKLASEDKPLKLKFKLSPIYKKNEKGVPEKDQMGQKFITEFDDGVWLWKCSKTVLESLIPKDNAYKGLMSRDFSVIRQGSGLEDTKYIIEPAVVDGGAEPLTVADNILAKEKYNLDAFTTPENYQDLAQRLSGDIQSSRANTLEEGIFSGQPMRSSAFSK
jgi:hypothetical protein